MESKSSRPFLAVTTASSPLSTAAWVCLVVALSYLVPKIEGAMILNPGTVWPLWPGCAILVSVLLIVPGRIWPILITAAFATFAIYDLEAGVSIKSIAWFIPANTVQVLTSALCLRYYFHGVPRLNSIKALAQYSFFAVILAPFGAAFLAAGGIGGNYWDGWRVCFLSEALAFITLMPAILGWITEGSAFVKKPRAYQLEAAALIAGLVLLSYLTFATSEKEYSPALLYSLVPFLLWAALRFGSIGISSSVIVVSFIAIWGAVHARGPFADQGSLDGMFSLQLFLTFAALPFMVLAAVVEERKIASTELALSNERVRLAMEAGRSVAWDLAVESGRNIWIGDLQTIFGVSSDTRLPGIEDFIRCVHPDDRQRVSGAIHDSRRNRELYVLEFRIVRPDGAIRWLATRGKFYYSADDEAQRMLGVSLDITERKLAEKAVQESEERFRLAAKAGKMFAYEWNAATDVIVRSGACDEILGIDKVVGVTTTQQIFDKIHPQDREGLVAADAALSAEKPYLQVSHRMLRSDGNVIWVERTGHAHFDEQGKIVRIVGMVADITQRKIAEEALASVSRRLIEAQEQERSRIARELHDDIGQRLSLMTVELDQLQKEPSDQFEVRGRISELWKQTSELTSDIHSLSHELHSSKLEHLGVAAAIRGFCREFGQQQNGEVDLEIHDVPHSLPRETSLCLFRVLQEALHNSAKHSGVWQFEVRLWGTQNEIHLTVRDSGSGFNSGVAGKSPGLGLISMQERLKLVKGTLSIDSQPKRGTTIHARVPVNSGGSWVGVAG